MNLRRGKLSRLKGQVKRTLGSQLPQPPALGHHTPLPGFAWGPPGRLILTQGMSTLEGSQGLKAGGMLTHCLCGSHDFSRAPGRLVGWLHAE